MQLARLHYHLNTRTVGGQALPDRGGDSSRVPLLEARNPRGLPESRALRTKHRGRGRGEPDLFRQGAVGPEPGRGDDAGGDSAESRAALARHGGARAGAAQGAGSPARPMARGASGGRAPARRAGHAAADEAAARPAFSRAASRRGNDAAAKPAPRAETRLALDLDMQDLLERQVTQYLATRAQRRLQERVRAADRLPDDGSARRGRLGRFSERRTSTGRSTALRRSARRAPR